MPGQPQHVGQRQGEQNQCFERQAFQRAQRGRLAQQAIAAEGGRQQQGDPGHLPRLPGEPGHAAGGQADGQPLQAAQAFVQQQKAQHDIDQGRNEVAEAGVDHVAIVDGPDIDEPVGREQKRTGHEAGHDLGLRFQAAQPAPLAAHGQHDTEEQERPDHAVRQDFLWRDLADGMKVQGEQAPAQEGEGGVQHAWIHDGLRRRVDSLSLWLKTSGAARRRWRGVEWQQINGRKPAQQGGAAQNHDFGAAAEPCKNTLAIC
ncbi:hypothetical protein D3C72_1406740 [compost metagenome]